MSTDPAQDNGGEEIEVFNEGEAEQAINEVKSNEVDDANLIEENLNSPSTATNIEEIDDSEAGLQEGSNITIDASEKE